MVYLDFTEGNDKVWRIQTSHLKSGWGYLFLRKIYFSAVYDYLCSYIYITLINLKCCKISHDLFIYWGFFSMSWWQWAHVGRYLIKFNKPLRQLVRWLMCQRTEYLAEKCSFEGKLKLLWIVTIFSKYFKISCFGVLSRVHEK